MAELSNLRRSRDDRAGTLPRGPVPQAGTTERATIVLAPIVRERFPPAVSGILIKAQPARDRRSCKFMFNREVWAGHSWRFDNPSRAHGSPLATALFELPEVRGVNVHGATVTVETVEQLDDWRRLATAIGAILRTLLEGPLSPIAPELVSSVPAEHVLRETVQRAIAEEINPGLAGHGGNVTLAHVQGNTLYLHMGGGCQGCAAAPDTLRFGIDEALRRWEPRIGLILDATDHAAGQNPYYAARE